MIKGNARGGPAALAAHLQRRDTNECIRLREFEGVTARDVLGALREMDAMGAGAESRRTLYHAAINTAPGERLTDDQKRKAVERLADELGLKDQPRIVVEHVKKDREHMHVVYMRIDVDRMRAIPDSHNFRKHEIVARDLERAFGHEPVKGVHVRPKEEPRPARTPSHGEMQQADRTGITPQQAKVEITALWQQADSGRAFAASVAAAGWVLAKGDRRDLVLVDRAGEPHSLARRVDRAKAADISQRMSDVDRSKLPSVAEAKELQRSQIEYGRTKEVERAKTRRAADPVMLKVNAPTSRSAALPLRVEPSVDRSAGKRPTRPAEKPKASEPQSASKQEPAPSPIKRFYTAAAQTTQRAYEKARKVLDKNKAGRTPMETAAKKSATPAPPLTPAQQETRKKLAEARVTDRAAQPKIDDPSMPERARPEPMILDRSRERRPKLLREEIQSMIERRHRQRDREGPSR